MTQEIKITIQGYKYPQKILRVVTSDIYQPTKHLVQEEVWNH